MPNEWDKCQFTDLRSACGPRQMTNVWKKKVFEWLTKVVCYFWRMCVKNPCSFLSFAPIKPPVLLLSLALLFPFAAESWFSSSRFIDMRCIRFASIVHLPFVCIVQGARLPPASCLHPLCVFWHFSTLCLNGLICIFSWAVAAVPLSLPQADLGSESQCRCKVAPDYWISKEPWLLCLPVCLCLAW